MNTLLIATSNNGKIAELRAMLDQTGLELRSLHDLGLKQDIDEKGLTYAENALLKATALAARSRLLTLADDSGLEVDVLGGLPGIRSARFSNKPHATDADRRAYLLARLQAYPKPWPAHFHCTIAIASPQGEHWLADGECAGEIIEQERGEFGFGYDPIFFMPKFGMTMAELPTDQKNQVSHRARAVQNIKPILVKFLTLRD